MKIKPALFLATLTLARLTTAFAHDLAAANTAAPAWFTEPQPVAPQGGVAALVAPAGNGSLMAASFAPFKPRVRFYWDGTTFYEESDNLPDAAMMPNLMVGITSWQQQIPVPASYFASTTNPENSTSSLGYGQPNYWRLPLVPVPSASPIPISSGNFQRGAVAIAANGIAIFNPKNNTGAVSYAIGELDAYGGHCGLADDYHYHIIPTHLSSRFGGLLSDDKPVAWALDGYPIYGFTEPDGTARQTLDADGGHDIGSGWGYHYHAIGTTTVDASHPYGTPQSPYLMSAFHGTVVNFGGQVDGQPEVGPIRASGTGGYTAVPVSGASIIAFKNPVALATDGSGNLIENVGGTASADSYLMRVSIGGTSYDECWKINRSVNPRTMTVTWRLAAATTTTTYTPSATGGRLAAYPMSGASQANLPDTGQTLDTTATFGEDADYSIRPQSFTDNGNGTITDNVTGLMWQKTDSGESTWETAVANAAGIATGGFTDWRLPTPSELFSIFNHNNANPALNTAIFPSNGAGAAEYWWTSDVSGSSTTNVWCANAGGGLGPKPKAETISAGGVLRYSARYVRGAKPTNGHNYLNNGDGTITDLDTGLMWTQLPGAGTTWDAALSYAEALALGGFSDWRLPNVKELQTLTDYPLANAVTPVVKPSLNRTMFAKTLTSCVTSAGGTTITCADTTGLIAGMPLVDTADIAGTYLPTATPPTVATIASATTFTVSSGTGIVAGSGFTMKALAPPTAFWTSTSQNNAAANAWVVEFGTNNTSTPPRNAQGIVSYNVKTATYPVFAVRTTATAAPTITSIANATTMKNNATTALTFTVGDAGTAAASLTLSASSSNGALVPNAAIVFGGSGANRTVTVTPARGLAGTVTITVTVSNGTSTTSTTFTLTVTPPNILLIVADDLGIDALSLYSSLLGNGGTGQFPPTPAIASLAANGVQFNHAYTYTVCSPSRASILTGRFAARTGVGNVVAGSSNNFLQAAEFTLPRAFAANNALNFQLKHFGKWHLTSTTGTGANLGPCVIGGWPAFTGSLPGQLADFFSWTKVISDGTAGGTSSTTSTTYETTDLVNDAVSFINTQTTAGKPWFATVAFNAPHITQATPFYQLPPASLLTAPATALSGTSADILANPRNYFDATIQAMDTEMVRLLAAVDYSKTNVIFVGDNGTFGSAAANSGSAIQAPFSASKAKATLYEGGIRVPLIIRGPEVVAPGRTTDALTHCVDLYATILEMAGINVASTVAAAGATIDSHSLLPVLQNTATAQSSLIYGEEFDLAFPTLGGRCLRDGQYKLIRKAAGVNQTTDEFYDLLADPYEATNLLAGGVGAMTTVRQTAYNALVTQLATFNTAPTISTIANQSAVLNTATGAIAFTIGDAEMSPAMLTVTGSSSNPTLVPLANVVFGGSTASRTATITPASGQTGTSTITVNVTDGAFTTSTTFLLTVTAAGAATTVSSVTTTPTVPSSTDAPVITATVSPATSRTISSVQLTYGTGAQTAGTVFAETMAATATGGTGGWDGTGAIFPWTLTSTAGAGNIKQTLAANHGGGNPCGLELSKGAATATATMAATTNVINASGTSGYVEFWAGTANVSAGLGWIFQLSPDGGTTWTTRLSDLSGTAQTQKLYHYDLLASERVGTLKLRFQFIGNGIGGPTAPKAQMDDITVVTTTGAAPVTVAMLDDGAHGDGAAGDGGYGVQLPAQTSGTTVSYTITATDSAAGTATGSGSYTTGPAPSITTGATLPNATASGGYSQTLAASGGTGTTYSWSVNASSTLPPGLALSSAGVLSGTVSTAGTYTFTLKATDSAGRIATRAFTLVVSATTLPNVVIILTDDQGWADVGYHTAAGQVPVQTPNMDALGTSGIRLEKFYPTTVCAVTRGCLLTGRNSLRTNVGNQKGLGLAEHLMPQTFKAAGYQTFMCGKWHLGGWDNDIYTASINGASVAVNHEGDEYLPRQRGWDTHHGQYGGAINYFTHTTADPGKNNALDWWLNGAPLTETTDAQGNGGYSTDLLADKAVAQIVGRDKAQPMLLYLAFNGVHAGVQAPPSYLTKYQNLGVAEPRRTLCAAVDCMDVAMGRVLAALESEGLTGNTLVLFMSDNGGDTTTGSINLPLRGTKSDSYDGGLHTPAAIRWPGHLAAGVTSNQYVWAGDIFPTVCAAAGVTPQNTKPFDGVNLWPQWQTISSANPDGAARGGPLVTGDAGAPVALDTFTDPVNGGSKVFKLIRNKVGSTITNELFNLTGDPYETADLLLGANAASYATIVTTLATAITGIVVENYPPYIGLPVIAQTVAPGSTITLYAPFTSYKAPTVQWRKNGTNLSNASPFFQVTNSASALVNGVFMATLTLTNITSADAASYDFTVTSTSGTATSAAGTLTVTAPALSVTPATGLTSTGFPGGPFTPVNAGYTVTNSGTGSMDWTLSKTAGWLALSQAGGTLAANASVNITVSLNTAANSLAAGSYSDTVTFTNTTNAVGNTTRSVSLTVTNAPVAPVLPTLATFSRGTGNTIAWPVVSGATSYTLQIAFDAGFTSNVVSQTVTSPRGTFTNLTSGTTYFYRVLATNGAGSSLYSNVVSSTQDAVAPGVAIASPASGTSTAANTITVTGTSSEAVSGISGVKVNNVAATSGNSFATWSATVPLGFGTNAITATATDGAGNGTTTAAVLVTLTTAQTYNPLNIPDTITGTTFNLALNQKTKQFRAGAASTTVAYNGALMWGPTLIMNKGDAVQMNVTNNLIDTTTVHWHGFHIPAIMDGGPHQTVPAGTTWSPSWIVKNDAATYWYHPHLHGTTMEQLVKGAGGFIIVRDPLEAALALPRTYGVDDFPLALTSRRFLTSNQFSYDHALDNYGDSMLVNGTLAPQVNLPKQYVRLRILNAEVARGYNLGFSDNRTFWVIANDQGLLSAPVAVTRVKLMVGERAEILVNLTADPLASSIELKAFNSGQVFGFPGQEGNPVTPSGNPGPINGSLLNNTDFNVLHINIGAATASPITALPATLVPQTYWTNANVTNTRSITLTGGNGGSEFTFNNLSYTPTLFNHTIALDAVEKWTISNNSGAIFGHSFHIHDIKFNIIARSGGTQVSSTGLAATYESGWKDTVYVPRGETVEVIAKFDDFASNTNPFMFHCHFLQHEDGGMMGQFLVVNNAVEDLAIASFTRAGANSDILLQFKSTVGTTYTLQYSSDLTSGSWSDIGSVTSNGTSANFIEIDATRLAQARGFYRVKIPMIP